MLGSFTLVNGVALYGGFPSGGGDWSSRDSKANVTILDGGQGGSVVTSPPGATATIDGFTIRNGSNFGINCVRISWPTISNNIIIGNSGGGINCGVSSATICNNTITGNSATNNGGGINCGTASSVTISDNTITGNSSYDAAIYCYSVTSAAISNNTITGNSSCGICCNSSSSATISNNNITGNGPTSDGGGIYCYSSSSPTICDNTIGANSSEYGGGIYCDSSSSPTITNNTITANNADSGGGIYSACSGHSSLKISNNIVSFNSSGIYSGGGSLVLRNNCVYNPDGANYSGLSAGMGDIQVDPKLVAVQYGQLHIQPDSPCVDAGYDAAVQPEWVDMDGQPRIQGAHVDIGADESDGTAWTFCSHGGARERYRKRCQ